MDQPPDSLRPARQWLKNNLVTLGSAAVFSVYSAGYFRTRDAAQRFAGEAAERHGAALSTKGPSVRAIAPPPEAAKEERERLRSTRRGAASPAKARQGQPPAQSGAMVGTDGAPGPAPAAAAPAVAATPTAPSSPAEAPVSQAPAPQPATAPSAESPAPAPAAKREEIDGYRDGVFYGWGTSRHGDIQASVEIKGGRIVGAYISQCLTRYSCSWVSMLPGQVVSRQSAEVDYVSGATQSSNAFYYAIVEALKQAK
jgi:uncharacterized protein with FMN-binding domain